MYGCRYVTFSFGGVFCLRQHLITQDYQRHGGFRGNGGYLSYHCNVARTTVIREVTWSSRIEISELDQWRTYHKGVSLHRRRCLLLIMSTLLNVLDLTLVARGSPQFTNQGHVHCLYLTGQKRNHFSWYLADSCHVLFSFECRHGGCMANNQLEFKFYTQLLLL